MKIRFQILRTTFCMFRMLHNGQTIPDHKRPLRRKGIPHNRHHRIRVCFFQDSHRILQFFRRHKRRRGIDTADLVKPFAQFFICFQHFQQHICRGGIVPCRFIAPHKRHPGPGRFRHLRNLFAVCGDHHFFKQPAPSCCFHGIRKNGFSTE